MTKKSLRKAQFSGNPFDLNRNGKIDPAEAACIMMIMDDLSKKREIDEDVLDNKIIEIDDMDIEGI